MRYNPHKEALVKPLVARLRRINRRGVFLVCGLHVIVYLITLIFILGYQGSNRAGAIDNGFFLLMCIIGPWGGGILLHLASMADFYQVLKKVTTLLETDE